MKKKRREEIIEELRSTDDTFRRLHDLVAEHNGGRIPSSREIARRLEARVARGRQA